MTALSDEITAVTQQRLRFNQLSTKFCSQLVIARFYPHITETIYHAQLLLVDKFIY